MHIHTNAKSIHANDACMHIHKYVMSDFYDMMHIHEFIINDRLQKDVAYCI